jgi:hypothetical protein
MIACLVDKEGVLYTKDGVNSYSELAKIFGVNENDCLRYGFSLVHRKMVLMKDKETSQSPSWAKESYNSIAQDFFDKNFSTIEGLLDFVKRGNVSRLELVTLLIPEKRQTYVNICSDIERVITYECGTSGDICLEEGGVCPFIDDSDEVCLQACLSAGVSYYEACITAWYELFKSNENRVVAWR